MKNTASRRTTLTLPSECLEIAERIARERHLNLSSVVGELLERGLREQQQAQRSDAILQAYSLAFAGFSAAELLLLDGIVTEDLALEKVAPARRFGGKVARRARK